MSIVYVVQAMNLDESMSLEGIFSSEKLAEEYCMVAGRKNPAWSLLYESISQKLLAISASASDR